MTFAVHGDLFSWCQDRARPPPGMDREEAIWPIVLQVLQGTYELHEISISHRDLSMENILMSLDDDGEPVAKLIDFSMATTTRFWKNVKRGKPSYQAPELHSDDTVDFFLCDAFSLGVIIFAIFFEDYPWVNTHNCKCFLYARRHGFRGLLSKRMMRNTQTSFIDVMSKPMVELLEGLLAFDPSERLTLGESGWPEGRRSVWDLVWVDFGPSVW